MDFQTLVNTLAPDKGNTIRAKGGNFTPRVDAMLEFFFANGELVLTEATFQTDETSQTVTIGGKLQENEITGLTATAAVTSGVFTLISETEVTAVLTIAVNDATWTLAKMFPLLSNATLGTDVPDTFFSLIQYPDAVLVLDSESTAAIDPKFRSSFGYPDALQFISEKLVRNLSMKSSLVFNPGMAANLVGIMQPPIEVAGAFEIYAFKPAPVDQPELVTRVPQFLLTTQAGTATTTIDIGDTWTFTVDLQVASLLQEYKNATDTDASALPTPALALRGSLQPEGMDAIPMNIMMFGDTGKVSLNMGTSPTSTITKGQLVSMLNGVDPGTLKPNDTLKFGDDFALEKFSVGLLTNPKPALESVSVTFGVVLDDGGWQMIPDVITVVDAGFAVTVMFSEALKPSLQVTLFATATLFDSDTTKLEALVVIPDGTFAADLITDGADLKKLFTETFGLGTSVNIEFVGAGLRLSGDLTKSSYTGEALFQEKWVIFGDDETNGLVLEDIYIKMTTTKPPEVAATFEGSVFASLGLAGAQIQLSAAWQSDGGWSFSGSTGPGEGISLTDLLQDVVRIFGGELPEGMPEMTLSQLDVSYRTLDKAFELTALVKLEGLSFSLDQLPVVGESLDPSDTLSLESIALFIANDANGLRISLKVVVRLGTTDAIEAEVPIVQPAAKGGGAIAPLTRPPATLSPTSGERGGRGTDCRRSTSDNQQPTTNNQQPTTNYQLPTTNYQLPACGIHGCRMPAAFRPEGGRVTMGTKERRE